MSDRKHLTDKSCHGQAGHHRAPGGNELCLLFDRRLEAQSYLPWHLSDVMGALCAQMSVHGEVMSCLGTAGGTRKT
jgi:hypothetical protein